MATSRNGFGFPSHPPSLLPPPQHPQQQTHYEENNPKQQHRLIPTPLHIPVPASAPPFPSYPPHYPSTPSNDFNDSSSSISGRPAAEESNNNSNNNNSNDNPDGSASPSSTATTKPGVRKRAASIDIHEANKHPRLQDLSLYTPATGRSLATPLDVGGGPRDLICLCTKAPKVPRPRNAFILYRQHYQAIVAAKNPGLANPDISKLIGEQWREQPEEVKNSWKRLAEEEKVRHQRQYPDYRYQPRRGGKNQNQNGNNAHSAGHKATAAGEDPSRCNKCGGRYIATPRTPSTPFAAAAPPPPLPLTAHTPAMAGGPPGHMPAYMTPNPRVIETDHLMRRGSSASMMSVDSHGRRYTQPHLRDIEEDYAMMSMSSPTHVDSVAKRRRVNGGGAYMPGSPPMGYAPYPGAGDPRYPQQAHGQQLNHRPSFSGGFGPPGPYQGNMAGANRLPRPPTSGGMGGVPQAPYRSSNNGMVEMQPPPRPSISYPGPVQTPSRPGGAFDESLRLPPLQTQLPNSPNMNSAVEAAPGSGHPNAVTGLGIMQNGMPQQHAQSQPQHQQVARQVQQTTQQSQQQRHPQHHSSTPPPSHWGQNYMLKLNMLRVISPPLKPPTPGTPPFETRGPIIAIEGAAAAPGVLKEVAAVVEKALSISGECVVRTWNGPNDDGHGDSSSPKSTTSDQDANGSNTVEPGSVQHSNSQPLSNPMANYIGRMLKWHRTSEEVIKFITANPIRGTSPSGATAAAAKPPEPSSVSATSAPDTSNSSKVPVAVFGTGYSLTQSDRYAAALPMTDAYQPEDHWKWVATLWRGIVGPDLTIYVKLCQSADEVRGNNCLEFANPAVVVLRVPGTPVVAATSAAAAAAPTTTSSDAPAPAAVATDVHVDERLERRLGFEIMEWVRSGSFRAAGGGKKPVTG
ncbi:hypothetical protein PG991_012977 [Apiospora marii]|uniref:HMG box domain-containing protein n=2 Tax=Apiospora marii TaxID=335849 RepID=A0ABR1RBC5_9PEZI